MPMTEARLVILDGPPGMVGRVHPLLQERVTVGRRIEHADIVIAVDSVSRRHAMFEHQDGVWSVSDSKSSTCGTFVNEERIEARVALRGGERIRLGAVVLAFVCGGDLDVLDVK